MNRYFKEFDSSNENNDNKRDLNSIFSNDFKFDEKSLREINNVIDENNLETKEDIINFVKERLNNIESKDLNANVFQKKSGWEIGRNILFGVATFGLMMGGGSDAVADYRANHTPQEIIAAVNEKKDLLTDKLIKSGNVTVVHDEVSGETEFIMPENFDETYVFIMGALESLGEIELPEEKDEVLFEEPIAEAAGSPPYDYDDSTVVFQNDINDAYNGDKSNLDETLNGEKLINDCNLEEVSGPKELIDEGDLEENLETEELIDEEYSEEISENEEVIDEEYSEEVSEDEEVIEEEYS